MEENRKDQEKQDHAKQTQIPPTRSLLLWLLAGAYLLYIGYTLCKGVLTGEEGASWGFFAAGVIFAIVGCVLLFWSARGYHAKTKADQAAEGEAKASEGADGTDEISEIRESKEAVEETSGKTGKEPGEEASSPAKPMTIAQRAKLASRLEDKEETAEK